VTRRSLRTAARLALALATGFLPVNGAAAQTPARPAQAPAKPPVSPAGPAAEHEAALAAAAQKAGRLDEAIAHYQKALEANPSWIEGRWALGSILYDLDRYEEARPAIRSVLAAQPNNAVALAVLGLCDFQLEDYDRAMSHLEAARTLGIPNREVSSVADFHIALLLTRAGKFEGAYQILRVFARLGQDTPAIVEAIGLAQLRLPYLPGQAPADKHDMIVMAGRAGYLMAQGRRSLAARGAFEELISRYPAEPNVHYAYGTCILPEDPDAAIAEYERELTTSPNHYLAMLRIATEQLKRSDPKAALPYAQKARELAPDFFASRLVLGRVFLEMGDLEKATVELEKATQIAPQSPEAFFSLGRVYQKEGREADAKRARARFLVLEKEQLKRTKGADAVGGIVAPENSSDEASSDKGAMP
jgi:tetratricopeptide (TPR) repeat protein